MRHTDTLKRLNSVIQNHHNDCCVCACAIHTGYVYSPFGAVTATLGNNPNVNPFRFSSEFLDVELGLTYYNYRHYNPTDGRWLSRDPIEEEGGYNLYGFVENNAIARFDYIGLRWVINRENTENRAIAKSETGDTIEELAKMIGLDPKEFDKWGKDKQLLKGSGNKYCSVSVPNVILITYGNMFLATKFAVHIEHMKEEFTGDIWWNHAKDFNIGIGYKPTVLGTRTSNSVTPSHINAQFKGGDVAIWGHVGHGNESGSNTDRGKLHFGYDKNTGYGSTISASSAFNAPFKLALATIYACRAGYQDWSHIAHNILASKYILADKTNSSIDWLKAPEWHNLSTAKP